MSPTQSVAMLRQNSRIWRETRDGVPVYVKEPRVRDWEGSLGQVCEQSAQEADVIRRIANSGLFVGRLGSVQLLDWKRNDSTIVTREVSGRPLQDFLVSSYRRRPQRECMRALLVAGHWLNVFQKLPLQEQDHRVISDQSPVDLVEYCDIRLHKLESLGYSGLNHNARRRLLEFVQDNVDRSSAQDRVPVLCHGDFGSFNILWDSNILTGIDFAQAHAGVPLLDVTYFIHRMSMLSVYFPWKHWPLSLWQEAFLKGYGRPSAVQSPMYNALMVRHLLCRLQTHVRIPGRGVRDKLHTRWVIDRVRRGLLRQIATDPTQIPEI